MPGRITRIEESIKTRLGAVITGVPNLVKVMPKTDGSTV